MERPAWLNNSVATIFGVIFFAPVVIFAYRLNTYILNGDVMSGGRLYWRQMGWSILTGLPFVGLIYGLVKLNDIIAVRNMLWERNNQAAPPAQ